jgi:hypothetical protein
VERTHYSGVLTCKSATVLGTFARPEELRNALTYFVSNSVADPDAYVFRPPESISKRYGSGFMTFYL